MQTRRGGGGECNLAFPSKFFNKVVLIQIRDLFIVDEVSSVNEILCSCIKIGTGHYNSKWILMN